MKKETKKSSAEKPFKPVFVQMPVELFSQVEAMGKKSGLSNADIVRLSVERGLAQVERMFEKPAEAAA